MGLKLSFSLLLGTSVVVFLIMDTAPRTPDHLDNKSTGNWSKQNIKDAE